MYMREALLHFCGIVGRSNKHLNADVTLPIHLVKQALTFTPAANAEILYILPSPPYLNTHNIIYTRATMHSATHQPPPYVKDLEDVDIDTMSKADKTLIDPATRDGATAGHGTAAKESQKERAKLMKTEAHSDWAARRTEEFWAADKERRSEARKHWLIAFTILLGIGALSGGITYAFTRAAWRRRGRGGTS